MLVQFAGVFEKNFLEVSMHYCCFIFTKEFPTDEILQKVLKPFNSEGFYSNSNENSVYPMFTWDYFRLGGRYSGMLKLEVKENDEKYKWEFYENNPRNNRLFRSQLIDTQLLCQLA